MAKKRKGDTENTVKTKDVVVNEPKPDGNGTEAIVEFGEKFKALGAEARAAGVGFVYALLYRDRMTDEEETCHGHGGIGEFTLDGLLHALPDMIADENMVWIQLGGDDDKPEDDRGAGETADV